MSKEKDPAFLFYSKNWIEGTAEMSSAEKGVYIDLLAHQHQKGDLPVDTVQLSRVARLGHDEFLKIWANIKDKFEVNGNRMVNRKLTDVMTERSEKGLKNTIIGTFASLLRLGNYPPDQYKFLKKEFKVDEFLKGGTDNITERLTEWLQQRLKSIGNVDVNVNVNGIKDSIKKESAKKSENDSRETDFMQPDVDGDDLVFPLDTDAVRKLWASWKQYRWKVHQSRYGIMGEQADLKRLEGMDYIQIQKTILTAIASKWKNLYPDKGQNNGKSNGAASINKKQQQTASTAQYVAEYYADKLNGSQGKPNG